MITPHKTYASAALIGLVTLLAWFALAGAPAETSGQPEAKAPDQPATPSAPGQRQADQAAVRMALDNLAAAFRKGDAKALAAHWTAEGEYTGDDGAAFRGRPALEKAYAELFAKNPGDALEVDVDAVRFPSRDNAVVEGHFKLRTGKKKELVVSRCSLLFTREDGAWLIALAREWPGDGLALRDLEWLVGTWEAKRDGTVVTTKYEWTAQKSFLRCHFTIAHDGETLAGTQVIGKVPSTGALHVWTFEDSGGVGDADVTRDGKKWVHAARGASASGQVLTATNIMTPLDADSFLWQAVERTLDGEPQPDLPPVKVVRVKAKR
jgi:uncharacterized protein (TIGR02246 family)